MADSETFKEIEQQIEAVLESESTDFFELAAMLDLDPKQDFAGADLSGVDLSGKDLSGANFTGSNLQGADLSHANLEGADFTDADLSSPLLLAVASTDIIARDLARDLALALARDLDSALALDLDSARDSDLDSALDLDSARALDLDSARALARDLDSARALASKDKINKIAAICNRLQSQYLGTTFRGANIAGICWDRANLTGALILNCEGLTSSDMADLKAKGAIFNDAPGERSPVSSFSPIPR